MNNNTWIVISNKGRTRIFEKNRFIKEWGQITVIPHKSELSELRQKGVARIVQRGRNTALAFRGMVNEESLNRRIYDSYFREVASFLNLGRKQDKYSEIILVANGDILGSIRNDLDKEVQNLIKKTINKDLAHYSKQDLEEYLHDDFIFTGDLHK